MRNYFMIAVVISIFGYFSAPRGIRNNNPGNIRKGENWEGMIINPIFPDKSFVQFKSPTYGVRAMARILRTYRNRGVVTLKDIISTWAPPHENMTDSYISSVMDKTEWQEDHVVSEMEGDYLTLINAIIKHENGINPYPNTIILNGINMS